MTSRPTSTGAGEPILGYRSLLAVRGYPAILAAQAVSRVGDSVHYIALAALIFSLTGSGLAVSGAVVFEDLPVLAFGALAGAVVDRLPRRRVMITADLARAALAVLMSQATAIPAIYALAFGLALGGVFHGPAYQSLVPAVVPARILGRANALTWSTVQSTHVLGAPSAAQRSRWSGRAGRSCSMPRRSCCRRCSSCASPNRHRQPRRCARRDCAPRPGRASSSSEPTPSSGSCSLCSCSRCSASAAPERC